jgi:hypothetical protein
LYTEASSDTLPLGASPLVINCDFILGSNLQRPGKQSQYYFSGTFIEKLTTFAQSVAGVHAPNEQPWTTPTNAELNTPGAYASATLNQLATGIVDAFDQEVGSSGITVNLALSLTPPALSWVMIDATFTGAFPLIGSMPLPSGFSLFPTGSLSNTFVTGQGVFPAHVPINTVSTQTFSDGNADKGVASGVLISCGTDGSTPVVTQIAGTVGTNSVVGNAAVQAGAALIAIIHSQMFSTVGQTVTSFTDTNGNIYTLAAGLHSTFNGIYGSMNWVYICSSAVANTAGHNVTYSYSPAATAQSRFQVFQVTHLVPLTSSPSYSEVLGTLNYQFSIPATQNVAGFQVEVFGNQSTQSGATILSVTAGTTTNTGQLPLSDGAALTLGDPTTNWGLTLSPAVVNNPNFGVSIVASAADGTIVTFSIYAVKIKIWLSPNPPPSFNYLKTFSETGGEVLTLALGSDGTIYQEDVNNLPGALTAVYSAIQPDSFAQSATVDDREFIAVSNLQNGTDIPYTYTPPNFDRLSQVGPGAPPSASTTASSETVVSITQFPAVTHDLETSGFRAVLWSAGPSTMSPGSTITIFYSRVGFGLAVADPHIVIGQGIKITGLPFLNGHANEPINGTYTVVSVGSGIPPNGNFSNQHWYFTVTAPSTQSGIQFTAGSGIAGTAYQVTLATMTTSAQIPNLEVGNQFQLAGTGGAPPAGYDGPWTVIDTPNAAQMQITSTVLLNNVATYGFNLITGANPVVGEFVTVTSTLNGNGVFNVANAVITSTSPGSFSISVTHANVTSAAETGAGIIFGTIFTFDPMQIIGNIFGGTIVTIGVIAAGVRKVCYSFLTRNGFLTQPSPILTFDVIAGASGIVIGDLLPGPSNVIARVVHLTAANGGNFYNIPVPVTVNDNGTNVINSSTWINDNFTTNVVLSFSDGVLLAADQIDIEGNNLFECGELGSCVALVPYAQRLFAIGEQNKITNLLNYSFDGGIIAATQYPAGWVVDPTSGAGGSVTASPIFGNAYLIKNLSGITQTTYGMITQAVFQDEFLVPIIVPSTTYSVRVTASCPTGAASGNLVADLYSPKLGIALGTFTVLLNSMQTSMQIFTGTLLTTVLAPVPDDLEIRLYTTNLPNGVQVLIDRIEPFPTELPNLNGQIIGSYQNNFEAFDRLSGVILATQQNQQPVVSAFAQFGTLYMVKTGSMVAVNDNNTTEPANWTTPRVISQSVGSVGVYAVTAGIDVANAGEEWALIGGIPGLFLFQGSQPVKLSEEIQSVWNQINWAYGYTMWVVNDIKNRRILVGAPLKALNSLGQRPFWLPAGLLTDNNPTTPNMVIELNYKQLNTASALMDSVQIHRSYSGKLIASDIVRKWSLWTIKSPCAALIQRPDTTSATFLGNSDHNGKIFALVDGLLEDDGAAVRQLYATAGFVPSETGQGMQIGMTRFIYNYMTLIIGGAGELIITVYPNSLDSPYAHALLPNLTLPLETNGDIEVPVDEAGSRLFVIFETNAVGAGFELSRLVMAMCQDAFSPIRGRND